MADYIEELKVVDKKYGIGLCIHESVDSYFKLTIYRLIENEQERKVPLPEGMRDEIVEILTRHFSGRKSFWGRMWNFFGFKPFMKIPPIDFSTEGITLEETEKIQSSWNNLRNCAEPVCS